MCSLDFGEIACNKYPVLLLLLLLYTHLYLIMLCGSLHFWRLPNFDFNNRSEIDYAKVIVKIIYYMIVKASGNGLCTKVI